MKLEPEKRKGARGQGMVEFALTIPIVLILMLGIIELGRLIFVYTSITAAGREAARYGAAIGTTDTGTPFYDDCAGIRAAAMRIGQFAGIKASDITLYHDEGLNADGTPLNRTPYCPVPDSVSSVVFLQGHRIDVEINTTYTPISPLVNLPSFPLISKNSHSVLIGSQVDALQQTWDTGSSTCDVTNFNIYSETSPLGPVNFITLKNDSGAPISIIKILIVWDGTGGPKLSSITPLQPVTILPTPTPPPATPIPPAPIVLTTPNPVGPSYTQGVTWNFPTGYSQFSITFSSKLKNNMIISLTLDKLGEKEGCTFGQ